MKNKMSLFCILVSLGILINSCKPAPQEKSYDEGHLEGSVFTSEEAGWTIRIPEGWKVTAKETLDENLELGKNAMEETSGSAIDMSGAKSLISFEKDQLNALESTLEKFTVSYEGEWEENNAWLNDLLYNTYLDQGLRTDTSSSETEIDGLAFNVFHMTVYHPDGSVLMYQDLYNRLINGYDFGVTLSYDNDADKKILEKALMESTFSGIQNLTSFSLPEPEDWPGRRIR